MTIGSLIQSLNTGTVTNPQLRSPLPYLSFFRKENWLQKTELLTDLC